MNYYCGVLQLSLLLLLHGYCYHVSRSLTHLCFQHRLMASTAKAVSGPPLSSSSDGSVWYTTLRLPRHQSMLSIMSSCGVCRRCCLRYLAVRDVDAYRCTNTELAAILRDTNYVGEVVPEFKDG